MHVQYEHNVMQAIGEVLDKHPLHWWLFSQVGVMCLEKHTWLRVDCVIMVDQDVVPCCDCCIAIEIDGTAHVAGGFANVLDAADLRHRKSRALQAKNIGLVVWDCDRSAWLNLTTIKSEVEKIAEHVRRLGVYGTAQHNQDQLVAKTIAARAEDAHQPTLCLNLLTYHPFIVLSANAQLHQLLVPVLEVLHGRPRSRLLPLSPP